MPYQEKSKLNLKPFTGANDPRRQNGRKKGQINRRTVIRELLTREIDPSLLLGESTRGWANNLSNRSYLEAVIYTLANQAIGGDTRASDLLLRELRYVDKENPPDYPLNRDIKISVVQSSDEIKRLEGLREELESQYGYVDE